MVAKTRDKGLSLFPPELEEPGHLTSMTWIQRSWEKLPVIPIGPWLFLRNFCHNSSLELLLKENFAVKSICRLNLILGMFSCPRRGEGRK